MKQCNNEAINYYKGFTLLEVLLSVAVLAIMLGVSIPVYQGLQVKNDTDLTSLIITQNLRRAQLLSQSVDSDNSWGVKVQSGSVTLFEGLSYSTRDITSDEVFEVSSAITPSGSSEIVFDKLTGLPKQTGSVTLTGTANNSKTITINSKGMIEY